MNTEYSVNGSPCLFRPKRKIGTFRTSRNSESVSCGGESGPEARICDYAWVLDTHMQCVEYSVPFYYHQTGARLRKGNRIYEIPREHQHTQAHKAHLDFDGTRLPAWDEPDTEAD